MNSSTPGVPVHHQLPEFNEAWHSNKKKVKIVVQSSEASKWDLWQPGPTLFFQSQLHIVFQKNPAHHLQPHQ